ncbi:hypothetical protein A3K70_02045 [Candidatus Bathyarchaeota archaeon RBG_16_48_13]|nr:MAG: hypothetical protein A3K70_02045 [Candidatus Bathyarchaeota archaeon RBG_16_48_13]
MAEQHVFEFGRPLHEFLVRILAALDSYKPVSLKDQTEYLEGLLLAHEITGKPRFLEKSQKLTRKFLSLQSSEGIWFNQMGEADVNTSGAVVLSLIRYYKVLQDEKVVDALFKALFFFESNVASFSTFHLMSLMYLLTKDADFLKRVKKTGTTLSEEDKSKMLPVLYLLDGNRSHLDEAAEKLPAYSNEGLVTDLWRLSNFDPDYYPIDITIRKLISSPMGVLNDALSIKEALAYVQGEGKVRRDYPETSLFGEFTPSLSVPLSILGDDSGECVLIGRSKEDQTKLGDSGTIYIGRICEKSGDSSFGKKILLDVMQPHRVFISGKTGSGKSYTLGVIVEELARSDLGIGVIIVDPMGTFWSMKYPVQGERDAARVKEWGLEPRGYENVKVFVPVGFYDDVPQATRDFAFAIKPSELTGEDWCSTFGISPYESPSGGLLMQSVKEVREGYEIDGEGRGHLVEGKSDYSIDDLIGCVQTDGKLVNMYKPDTIRAVKMRLEVSKHWGVFSQEGLRLETLSVKGQVSVLDVSQLGDSLRALVVGILARKILDERTRLSREFEASKVEYSIEKKKISVPVTWLLVDEAHVLAPSAGKTAASEPLIEYAKRGRMPGCGLILCTQQPAAMDTRILSQLDLLITHTLIFADDIAALKARTPTFLPKEIGDAQFIRRIPVGDAIIADHSVFTERAFLATMRPRTSEHAGRAVTPEIALVVKKKVTREEKVLNTLETPPIIVPATRKGGEFRKRALTQVKMPVSEDQEISVSIPILNVEEDLLKKHQMNVLKRVYGEEFKKVQEQNTMHGQSFIRRDPESFLKGFIVALKEDGWSVDKVREEIDSPVIYISRGDVHIAFALAIQRLIFSWFAGTEKRNELADFGQYLRGIIQRAEAE